MITQCPKCLEQQEIPDPYRGREIKCLHCKEPFHATETMPLPQLPKPDVVAETIQIVKKHNPIRSAWNKMPKPFKTAFLSTFGVMSALLITYYVYGNTLGIRTLKTPKSPLMSLEKAKSVLAEKGLFHDGRLPQKGILRGRALTSICFVPDANKDYTELKLWSDENNYVVGISARWYGSIYGSPVDLLNDSGSYDLFDITSCAFRDLTGFKLHAIVDLSFKNDGGKDIAYSYDNIWAIVVTRTHSSLLGDKSYNERCKMFGGDKRVYQFLLTAQSW
jgi:hypothetical protein